MHGPEYYEKQAIKKYLESICAWYFCPYMAGFGASGVPDIIACIRGELWGIEVKREGKKPTTIQQRRMDQIEQSGGYSVAGTAAVVIEEIEKGIYRRHA